MTKVWKTGQAVIASINILGELVGLVELVEILIGKIFPNLLYNFFEFRH
jgi:hypothetical protein